jgi:protein-S-isoprenylcysteine O-methyltransferase Ste14
MGGYERLEEVPVSALPRLGSRGQGWVWGQFALVAVVLVTAAIGPRWSWPGASWLGAALIVLGGGLGLWSLAALGDSLSPYPKPRRSGELVEHGPYRVVRHPIYSSLLVALLGVCCVGSGWALLPLAGLLTWWLGKAHIEEAWLCDHYPGYPEYCERVPHRIIPMIL